MNVQRFLYFIDGVSTWVGKAAAWLIIVLTAAVCVEVFKRYITNMPTAWIFDADNIIYGTLFMLCGAYTLAQNAQVVRMRSRLRIKNSRRSNAIGAMGTTVEPRRSSRWSESSTNSSNEYSNCRSHVGWQNQSCTKENRADAKA